MNNREYDPTPIPLTPPTDPPPDVRRRPLRVQGPRETLWIVSPGLCQTYEHYTGVRRMGCRVIHGHSVCPWCKAGLGTDCRWWLTLARQEGPDGPTELLALTRVAVQSCPDLFRHDGFLWGRRLTVWRHPPIPTGVMYAELDSSVSPKDLPRAEPTLHSVIRLWQAATRPETLRRQPDCQSAADVRPPLSGEGTP